jgi:DNA (cytosine-5)-methyltransferase 1
MMKKEKLKIVSLFSGCGGLDLGFAWEGFNVIWANDNMKDACITYEKNIGHHIVCKDIKEVEISTIPKADLVIGGPPCQGFSGIGKRDPNDERSSLVWDYIDILKHVKPKIFLFENVTGLMSARAPDGTRVIDNLVHAFESTGYHINVHVLNAADYGVPQRRNRVFIIGNNFGADIPAPKPTHSSESNGLKKWVSSFEAISDLGKPSDNGITEYVKSPDGEYQKFMRMASNKNINLHLTPYASKKDVEIMQHVKPGGNYRDVPDKVATQRILYFKKTGGRTTTYGRLDPQMPNYTLNTYFDRPNIGCNIHYKDNRMITIREGLRFQSFPDDFNLHSSNKRNYYVQVGNAVPPLLSKAWAVHLKKILSSSK